MSYGVNVTNIYELLSEDGEVQVKAPAKQAAKAPAKTSVAPAKTSTKPTTQQTQKPQTSNATQPARGGASSRPPQNRPPRQQRTTAPASEVTEGGDKGAQKDSERRERKRGTFSSGPQRVYDRRSGTGRGRENKKGGAGRGNWGADTEANPSEANAEKPTEEKPAEAVEGEKKEAEKEEAKHEEEEEEEKDNTKTFEEYLAEKAAKKPTLALPESRKINSGADPKEVKKWEKYEVLKREFDVEVKEAEEEEETAPKKSKKQTVPLNEVFDVRTPPIRSGERGRGRGRGGFRGGRGGDRPDRSERSERGERSEGFRGSRGGRGRGGRGGNRGGDRPATEINIDEQSFPALKPKA